jgi:hypothetical protein
MTRHEYQLWGAKAIAKRGESLPQSRLNIEAVKAIRRNVRGETAKQLADKFGVHIRTIDKVRDGKSWVGVI